MIRTDERACVFENENMRIAFSLENGLRLTELYNRKSGRSWLAEPSEVFSLNILKTDYPASSFAVTAVQEMRDRRDEGFSIDLHLEKWGLDARIVVLSDDRTDCALFLKLGAAWPDQQPQEIYYSMPFIAAVRVPDCRWRLSGNPSPRRDGSSAMATHPNYPMPACVLSGDDRDGFSLRPYELDIGFGGLNLTGRWFALPQEKTFVENRLYLMLDNHPLSNIYAFKLTAIANGWEEAFARWREDMRDHVNLREYEREDLRWLREAIYPAYSFSYSRQVFDYESQCMDIDRLLDEGERIGGYDAVILWHQYPRLGVDRQGQFDFNHNVPDGMAGLRKMVQRAHARNVKVLFPYNPWDDTHLTEEQAVDEMVEMVRQTDCDGFLLDTMETVPLGMRQKIDAVKSGVGFISEGAPVNTRMVELITAHQDQSPDFLDMPQSFVLRYLYPEMNCFTTGRWRIGEGKDMLIDRMVFNGTGMLVWEEVFGRWLPHGKRHIDKLNRWRKILSENRDLFQRGDPTPFWTVWQEGLYANRFASKDGRKLAFAIYNGSDHAIAGTLLDSRCPHAPAQEVWGGVCVENDGGVLRASLEAGQTILVLMQL